MINGLGVLGYGVGGIEAEAVLLGQPLYQPMPRIVGVRLSGELPRTATATDLVLVITEMLRKFGVVGSFVEFAGDGLAALALADRATISNMSPEFGATSTLFPIDDETLAYLRLTGRPGRAWTSSSATPRPRACGASRARGRRSTRCWSWTSAPSSRRWPDRGARRTGSPWPASATTSARPSRPPSAWRGRPSRPGGRETEIGHGSVAIAAITSCTNTSNPTVMVGAGLLARNAVARGLTVNPAVKTSLAPGPGRSPGISSAPG